MKITYSHEPNPLAKAFARALESVEAEVEYRKLTVVEELLQYMKRNGINKGELAERMGVSNSRITAMLSGDSNLTIDTLVRAGRAVGADLVQTFVPHGQKGVWVERKPAAKRERSGLIYQFQGTQPPPAELGLANREVAREDTGHAA